MLKKLEWSDGFGDKDTVYVNPDSVECILDWADDLDLTRDEVAIILQSGRVIVVRGTLASVAKRLTQNSGRGAGSPLRAAPGSSAGPSG